MNFILIFYCVYAAVVDYELTSFQFVLNLMNRIQCDRVRIFHDGVFYGYSKYFALQISRVDSNIHVDVNKKFLLVRIKESDSKSHIYLIHIANSIMLSCSHTVYTPNSSLPGCESLLPNCSGQSLNKSTLEGVYIPSLRT